MIGTMPYFYKGENYYPCELSALSVKVDFENGKKLKTKPTCIYTEEEIKQKLNIKLVDNWDAKNKKVIKTSNLIISSIPKGKGSK